MSKKLSLIFALLLAVVLFGAVSIASADDNLSGDWSGSWDCPGCPKTGGAMRGHIVQNNQSINGTCLLENTIEGTVSGRLSGTASDGNFNATIVIEKGGELTIDGTYQGNTIKGEYYGMGDGSFTLHKD